MRILLGGSPCTHWSVAKAGHGGRETAASGAGWELFRNYLIAREKFRPDFFLYENVASASPAIKAQISSELGAPLRYINSALVSAQMRKRFYVHNFGDVPQPEDRGILLKDILEDPGAACVDREKSYTLKASNAGNARDYLKKHPTQVVFEPVVMQRAHGYNKGGAKYGKAPTLTANGSYVHNNHVVEPVIEAFAYRDKSPALLASYAHAGQRNFIEDIGGPHTGYVGVPIRIGEIELDGESHAKYTGSAANRVYSPEGKARTLISNGGGGGAKTGLYAVPSPLDAPASTDTPAKGKRVYTVKDGKIEKDGMFYPINLPDGAYIMRKLTVRECCRLQTLPDDYFLDANGVQVISDTQAVKATGNGWTAEVIIHILSHGLRGVPRDEPLEVLSMYDGIATGRYCLEKLGFSNVRYYGSEIDKYAIKAALNRFPDIKHLGDAFAIREFTWEQWKKSVD